MTKNVVVPGSPPQLYSHAANDYRPYPRPVSNGPKLLSLDPANAADVNYVYWDYDSSYQGALRVAENGLSYSNFPTFTFVNGGNTLLITSAYQTGATSANLYGFDASAFTLSTSNVLTDLDILTRTIDAFNPVANAPAPATSWALGARISGLCEYNGRIMGNVYGFYDGGFEVDQTTFVLDNAASPGVANERGFFAAPNIARSAGWISELPADRKTELEGTHIFGMSSGNLRSINARFSIGPSLYVYDADAANSIVGATPPANGSSIPATPMQDYPLGETTGLTPTSLLQSPGQPWTSMSEAYYGFIVPGTDTYFVVGFSGGHESGVTYGVSPWDGNQGNYVIAEDDIDNHYWCFRVSDIIDAKNGVIQPYEVPCYEHGRIAARFEGPKTANGLRTIRGGYFDSVNNRLVLVLASTDTSQATEWSLPLLLFYDLSGVVS